MGASARIRSLSQDDPHRPSAYCLCRPCKVDREKNCINPNECTLEAKRRIKLIPPKLNPTHQGYHHGNLSLTRTRKGQNMRAQVENGAILFDPTITTKNNLAECFRIFTDPAKISNELAMRHQDPRMNDRHATIKVFTDRACYNNGKMCHGLVAATGYSDLHFPYWTASSSFSISDLISSPLPIVVARYFLMLPVPSPSFLPLPSPSGTFRSRSLYVPLPSGSFCTLPPCSG